MVCDVDVDGVGAGLVTESDPDATHRPLMGSEAAARALVCT